MSNSHPRVQRMISFLVGVSHYRTPLQIRLRKVLHSYVGPLSVSSPWEQRGLTLHFSGQGRNESSLTLCSLAHAQTQASRGGWRLTLGSAPRGHMRQRARCLLREPGREKGRSDEPWGPDQAQTPGMTSAHVRLTRSATVGRHLWPQITGKPAESGSFLVLAVPRLHSCPSAWSRLFKRHRLGSVLRGSRWAAGSALLSG